MFHMFSFWRRPLVKKILHYSYFISVIFGSIFICYWSFNFDVGPPVKLGPKPKIEMPAPLTCEQKLQIAQADFELDSSVANWLAWAEVDKRCKDL